MGTHSTVQCLNTLQLLNYNISLWGRLFVNCMGSYGGQIHLLSLNLSVSTSIILFFECVTLSDLIWHLVMCWEKAKNLFWCTFKLYHTLALCLGLWEGLFYCEYWNAMLCTIDVYFWFCIYFKKKLSKLYPYYCYFLCYVVITCNYVRLAVLALQVTADFFWFCFVLGFLVKIYGA